MIITTIQAQEALIDIIARTDWTYSKIGRECGIHPDALRKVVTGETRNMSDQSLAKVEKLHKYVIKHTDAPA